MKEFWSTLSLWKKIKFVLSVILGIYVLLFALVNWQEAEINFILFKVQISITLLILVCLVVGYLVSNIFDYKKYKVKDLEIKNLKSQLEEWKAKID